MIIYLETRAKNYTLTQDILRQFPQSEVIEIQHYKNLFDKTIGDYPLVPCLILAEQSPIPILETPPKYGFPGKSFFFKPSINCIFDCSYCYLKGTFKNSFPVIFVNYEEMQEQIAQKIGLLRTEGYEGQITFYASNYSDVLAIDHWTHFNQSFFPFFEKQEHVLLETRTKSANISSLLQYAKEHPVPKNIEIALSLSPQSITTLYEKGTASLSQKLKAIQTLLTLGYRVGLRFLPLLPLENYQERYAELMQQIKAQIDITKISSIFIAPLIYNTSDYLALQKKSDLPFLSFLHQQEQGLMKMQQKYYDIFEALFTNAFPDHQILRDYQ